MERARSFGREAASYERARPAYPAAAVRWLLGDAPLRVLDLGAGTGKLTRALLAHGHDVVAVEPDGAMRAQLTGALPEVQALAGTAEDIPLPDESVDAVVAGQAYHWFDAELAPAEIGRVLRSGGTLGLVWNLRDDAEPWLLELARRAPFGGSTSVNEQDDDPELGPPFAEMQRARFSHVVRTTGEDLIELMRSTSWVIVMPASQRAAVELSVRDLLATHPALAGRESFDVPYVTFACRAVKRP